MSIDLTSLTFQEMESLFTEIPTRSGNARHRAETVFRGLYREHAGDLREIEPLARDFLDGLHGRVHIGQLEPSSVQVSADGTRKFLFDLDGGAQVESVWIPARWGNTLCISSQAGCAMGCTFCHTGTMGLFRNLTTEEIVGQVAAVARERAPHGEEITGVVFMGMGEPLHNYEPVSRAISILLHDKGFAFSHNRVTVSTVGLVERMEQLGREHAVNLCVSIHSPFEEVRQRIVPAERRWPLSKILQACRDYPEPARRRIIFAYTVIPGVNDSAEDADALRERLDGLPNKINMIPFNPFPGSEFRRPTDEEVEAFQRELMSRGFRALYRTTRGDDIMGACGQLAARSKRTH